MSDFIEERLLLCSTCEYNMDNQCILCGCNISTKVLDPEESCPLHQPRWGKQSEVIITKLEIESAPAQVPTLQSTAPQQKAVCLPCQSRSR